MIVPWCGKMAQWRAVEGVDEELVCVVCDKEETRRFESRDSESGYIHLKRWISDKFSVYLKFVDIKNCCA